jgi:hypothetical protein
MRFGPNRDAGSVRRHRCPHRHRRASFNEGWLYRIDDGRLLRRLSRDAIRVVVMGDADDADVMRRYRRPECAAW